MEAGQGGHVGKNWMIFLFGRLGLRWSSAYRKQEHSIAQHLICSNSSGEYAFLNTLS